MSQTPVHATPPDDREQKSGSVAYRIIRGMFVVLFFWIFWKFGGFLLNAVVGRVYGASAQSDAYFFAAQSVVYLLIFSRLMKILIPSFTPVFIDEKNDEGEEAAWDFASTILNLLLVGGALTMLVFYVYAEPITDTLVRGFGDEARALGIRLLRWILPGAVLMMLYLPMRALLNSYKTFSYPSAGEAAQKLIWAVGLYVTYRFLDMGILAVAAGFLTGTVGMIAITLFGMRKHLHFYRFRLPSLRHRRLMKECATAVLFLIGTIGVLYLVNHALPAGFEYTDIVQMGVVLVAVIGYTGQLWLRARDREGVMARFAALAAPLVVSTAFAAFRDVVTYYFQSFTARGVFSDIEFARHIVFVPTTVVAYALSVAMFPYLCELASNKDHKVLGGIITKAIRMLAIGFVPLAVMTIILSGPVSRLVFDRGDWSHLHLHYTGLALALLAIGLIMYAWEYVIMQGYFSLQRMWPPAIMGIIATFFQFGFLAIPIYVLHYDYPVQIFYLAALAYPVSRYFKNLILLGMLRRHLPVLPARSTLIFGLKLAIFTAGIGAATWFGHRWFSHNYPFAPYRQHKVIVNSFETSPETWFSLNAAELGLRPGPVNDDNVALRTRYNRHGETRCSIYRHVANLKMDRPLDMTFRAYSREQPGKIAVELKRDEERNRVLTGKLKTEEWTKHRVALPAGFSPDTIHWLEIEGPERENVLYLDDIQLTDPKTGKILWQEDFDGDGWNATAGTPVTENVSDQPSTFRYALRMPADATTGRDIATYNLQDTTRFRYRLLNRSEEAVTVDIALESEGKTVTHTAELPAGDWTTVDKSWEELGFPAEKDFGTTDGIEITTGDAPVYLDDVTFRRPPRRIYELIKFLHCVVATLAGIFAGALLLPLLRFEETNDVIRWVKEKGWQKSEDEVEEEIQGDLPEDSTE